MATAEIIQEPIERIKQSRFWSFIRIIKAQHEEVQPEIGWSHVFCRECDVETKKRMSLENFADYLDNEGWAIIDVECALILCSDCQNADMDTQLAPGMCDSFDRADHEDNFGGTD